MSDSSTPPGLTPASASQRRAKPERKPPTLRDSHLVKLFAGKSEKAKSFTVHRHFVTYYTPVLKAAFESNFIEGQTQEYRFDDFFNHNTIMLLGEWFYTQNLNLDNIQEDGNSVEEDLIQHQTPKEEKLVEENPAQGQVPKEENSAEENVVQHQAPKEQKLVEEGLVQDKVPKDEPSAADKVIMHQIQILVELWVLAEHLLIPKLQNQVMNQLQKVCSETRMMAIHQCCFIYENTAAGSVLRRWIVSDIAFLIDESVIRDYSKQYPHEMLVDVFILLASSFPERVEQGDEQDMEEFIVPEDEGEQKENK